MASKYPPPVSVSRYPPPVNPTPPPPPPPRGGGGFGRQLLGMVMWGAGIAFAFAGVNALFGGRRTQEVHHPPPQQQTTQQRKAFNPALTRPMISCAAEEDVLRQCQSAGGDCAIYLQRVQECHRREAAGTLGRN